MKFAFALPVPAALQEPYPPSVVFAGLETVFDLKASAGRNLVLLHSLPADLALLPAGSAIVGNRVNIGSNGVISNFDFTGYGVYINGGRTVAFSQCKFAAPGAGVYLLAVGTNASVPGSADVVTVDGAEFDGKNTLTDAGGNHGAIRSYGSLSLNDVWMHDAPSNNINFNGLSLIITNSYLQCPGKLNAGAPVGTTQHVDNIHIYNGVVSISDTFFDNFDGAELGIAGSWTSPLAFPQTQNAAGYTSITTTFDRIIHRGGAAIIGAATGAGAAYAYQYGGKDATHTLDLTIQNSVLQVGTSGKFSFALPPFTTATYLDNVNYDTALPANLPSGP